MSVYAILVCGGSGTRMGADRNKTLLPVGGVPACVRAGRTLLKATGDAVGEFSVVLPAGFAKGCYIVKLLRNNAVVKYGKLMVR